MNYACTTQVPNRLFDELLRELTLSELKLLLAVNRATWGWVTGPNGRRRERAWLTTSRIKTLTGLSKRAISDAITALIKRRLLCVTSEQGLLLDHPRLRQGHVRLYFSLCFPQVTDRRSAHVAEPDQQQMLTIETNRSENQSTVSLKGRTAVAERHQGHIGELLAGAVSPKLLQVLRANEKTGL